MISHKGLVAVFLSTIGATCPLYKMVYDFTNKLLYLHTQNFNNTFKL